METENICYKKLCSGNKEVILFYFFLILKGSEYIAKCSNYCELRFVGNNCERPY